MLESAPLDMVSMAPLASQPCVPPLVRPVATWEPSAQAELPETLSH